MPLLPMLLDMKGTCVTIDRVTQACYAIFMFLPRRLSRFCCIAGVD